MKARTMSRNASCSWVKISRCICFALHDDRTRGGDDPREPKGALPRAKGRAAAWTEERRRSDEGRWRVKSARRRAGQAERPEASGKIQRPEASGVNTA